MPLWFLVMTPLLLWVGPWFFNAWEGLNKTGVLKSGSAATLEPCDLISLGHFIDGRKKWLCLGAILISLLINVADMKETIKFHGGWMTLEEQVSAAKKEPDFFIRWWFEQPDAKAALASKPLVSAKKPALSAGWMDWLLLGLIYLQQFFLATMAVYFFLRLFDHAYIFGRFNTIDFEGKGDMRVELNVCSPVQEFGMEHWNQLLNNLYWYMSVALVIPITSKLSQSDAAIDDTGQQILKIAVSVLLLAPMIATILSRQMHLPSAWQRIRADDVEMFHNQRLWPLDRNWASKMGIVLAFTLASTLLGSEYLKIL